MFGWLMRLFGAGSPAPAAVAVPVPFPEAVPAVSDASVAHRDDEARGPQPEAAGLLRRTEVLDRGQNLVGYSFELREELTDNIRATGRRVRDFIDGMLVEQIARHGRAAAACGRGAYVRIWDGFLENPSLLALAEFRGHVLVRPENAGRPAPGALVAQAQRLREAGARIVLDCNEAGPWLQSMIGTADAAVFRMALCLPDEIALFARTVARLRKGVPVWAWEVGTMDDFELAHRVGCQAFSGGFVVRRGEWKGNRLSPHGLRLAALLDRLRSGVDTHEIAEILKHDMALAYRLLRYVNAAAWGLQSRITSVEQAIVVLGQQPLQRWVSMMLMGSAREAPGAGVVMEAALARARFLELLGAHRGERDPAAQLFVLGLFSMLDVALKLPLEEALRPLNLSEPMQEALLHRRGPMAPYLELALALEKNSAEQIRAFAGVLGVGLGDINRLQFEALEWVQAADA